MTLRGQRLFVRPIETADREALQAFLAAHGDGGVTPETGLIGKLVGNLVAAPFHTTIVPGLADVLSELTSTYPSHRFARRRRMGCAW